MAGKTLVCLAIVGALLGSIPAQASYRGTLRHHTETGRIYKLNTLDSVLLWNATYYSAAFRRAFEKKHARIKYLDPLETALFVAQEEAKQEKNHEFFVGLFTQNEFREFSTDRNSFWQVVLTAENGMEMAPDSVAMVPVGPYERKMFPYLNRWSQAYRVTFPKAELGKHFTLTLRSIEGSSTLKWDN